MGTSSSIILKMEGGTGGVIGRIKLPLRVQVQDIDAVLITADAYDALCQTARKSVGSRSKIERDQEVQCFIDERLGTHELPILRDAILQQFGLDRTPSSSGLHRYAMARRKAAAGATMPVKRRGRPRGPR